MSTMSSEERTVLENLEMNTKVYKWCAVPQCKNTSIKTPNKVFVHVPTKKIIRDKWLKLARRNPNDVVTNSPIYFCEDHFDLTNDMENYMEYHVMGSVSQVRMKQGCLPKKFLCQSDRKTQTSDTKEGHYIAKKRRKMILEECGKQFGEKSIIVTEKSSSEEIASSSEMEMHADDIETHSDRNQLCCGCLQSGDELVLKEFNIKCEPLKDILKVDSIILCYMCKQNARKAEFFIQNVQNNQILLQNYEEEIPESKQWLPPPTLTQITLPHLELSGADDEEEESCTVMSSVVKIERMDDDANEDTEEIFIKEEVIEEVTSDNLQLKEEVTLEEDSCSEYSPKTARKGKRRDLIIIPRRRNINLVKTMSASTGSHGTEYTLQRVTEKQCMKEREQRSQESHYLLSLYRCADCVKGFMLKTSFDMHMKLHSSSRGDVLCNICKQRFETSRKMQSHKKCHIYRYKCTRCEIHRISHHSIRKHFAEKHSSFGSSVHQCTVCPKVYKNRVSLRRHEGRHSTHERVTCDVCQRTFISKHTLQAHILRKHPPDGVPYKYRKRYVCQHCGLAFKAPYQLKNHVTVHSESRPYYCVECDRSFKTDRILARHLKCAARHVYNTDLNISCEQCGKKFPCRRNLERHVNSVHLNLKPHACDKCDRAYLNSWSLREHKMYSHEGHRKERCYPCTLCDKVFDRSSILKSHIRTHTGERPYRCKHCPSQFVQSSQLRTHTNLVHLKLTRDGKPKSTALK